MKLSLKSFMKYGMGLVLLLILAAIPFTAFAEQGLFGIKFTYVVDDFHGEVVGEQIITRRAEVGTEVSFRDAWSELRIPDGYELTETGRHFIEEYFIGDYEAEKIYKQDQYRMGMNIIVRASGGEDTDLARFLVNFGTFNGKFSLNYLKRNYSSGDSLSDLLALNYDMESGQYGMDASGTVGQKHTFTYDDIVSLFEESGYSSDYYIYAITNAVTGERKYYTTASGFTVRVPYGDRAVIRAYLKRNDGSDASPVDPVSDKYNPDGSYRPSGYWTNVKFIDDDRYNNGRGNYNYKPAAHNTMDSSAYSNSGHDTDYESDSDSYSNADYDEDYDDSYDDNNDDSDYDEREIDETGSGAGPVIQTQQNSGVNGSWRQDAAGWKFDILGGGSTNSSWIECITANGSDWYHFDAQGYMDHGWYTDTDGNVYYLHDVSTDGNYGAMCVGWNWIGGKCYYFNVNSGFHGLPKGALMKNDVTFDGYTVNELGEWTVNGVVQTQAQ